MNNNNDITLTNLENEPHGCSRVTQDYLNSTLNLRKKSFAQVKAEEEASRIKKIKKSKEIKEKRIVKYNFTTQSWFSIKHEHGISPEVSKQLDSLVGFMENFNKGIHTGSEKFNLSDTVRSVTSVILGTTFDAVIELIGQQQQKIMIFCLRVAFSLILFTVFAFSNLSIKRKIFLITSMSCILMLFGDDIFVKELNRIHKYFTTSRAQNTTDAGELLLPIISLIGTTLLTGWSNQSDTRNKNESWSKLTMDSLLSWHRLKEPINDFSELFQKAIQFLVDNFQIHVLGQKTFQLFSSAYPKIDEWITASRELLDQNMMNTLSRTQETCFRVMDLQIQGIEIKDHMIYLKERKHLNTLTNILMRLYTLQRELESEGLFVTGDRSEPCVGAFSGVSGVGKSMVMRPLMQCVLATVLTGEKLEAFKRNRDIEFFVRCIENVYWEGYHNQMVVIIDDFLQTLPNNAGAVNDAIELIRAGNNFPWHLHYAAMSLKTGRFFQSDFIILSTNQKDIQFASQNYVVCAEAVERRIDLWYEVTIKEEFCVPGTYKGQSLNTRRLDTSKVKTGFNPDIYEFYQIKRTKTGSKLLFTDKCLTFWEVVDAFVRVHRTKKDKHNVVEHDTLDLVNECLNIRQENGEDVGVIVGNKAQGASISKAVHWFNGFDQNPMTNLFQKQGLVPQWVKEKFSIFLDVDEDDEQQFHDALSEFVSDEFGMAVEYLTAASAMNIDDTFGFLKFVLYMLKNSQNINIDFEFESFLQDANLFTRNESTDMSMEYSYGTFVQLLREYPGCEDPLSYSIFRYFLISYGYRTYNKPDFDKISALFRWISYFQICCFKIPAFASYYNDMNAVCYARIIEAEKKKIFDKHPYLYTSINLAHSLAKAYALFWLGRKLYSWFSSDGEEEKNLKDVGRKYISRESLEKEIEPAVQVMKAQGTDPALVPIMAKVIAKNVYAILWGDVLLSFGYFVTEQGFICPKHTLVRMRKAFGNAGLVTLCDPFSVDVRYTFTQIDLAGAKDIIGYDCSIMELPNMRRHANILHLLVDKETFGARSRGTICIGQFDERPGGIINLTYSWLQFRTRGESRYVDSENTIWSNKRSIDYVGHTRNGDCGLPVFLDDASSRSCKLLGFHVAASAESGIGMASILYQELFLPIAQSGNDKYPGWEHVRDLDKAPGSGMVSKIRKSNLYGRWGPAKLKPAHLTKFEQNGEVISPLQVALSKYSSIKPEVPSYCTDLIRLAVRDTFDSPLVDYGCIRQYTFEEAVMGLPGDKGFKSINRSTSPGYPYNLVPRPGWPGKTFIFGKDPEFDMNRCKDLKKKLLDLLSKGLKEGQEDWLFTGSLKDETRPIAKVDMGKTRYFAAAPMEYCIMFNMFFGSYKRMCYYTRLTTPMCVGINPYSSEWDVIAHKLLANSDKMNAGDYAGFDSSQLGILLAAMGEELVILIAHYVASHYSEDEVSGIMLELWKGVHNSHHIIGRKVYKWFDSLPSGHPMTTHINTIYGIFLLRFCWEMLIVIPRFMNMTQADFVNHIVAFIYGDDVVMSISDIVIDKFNMITMAAALKTFGITLTDEIKSLEMVKFRAIGEISFLKRKFRYEEAVGRYVAPLSLDTILEIPYWTKKGPLLNDIPIVNSQLAIKELSLHDDRTFYKWAPIIARALREEYNVVVDVTNRLAILHVTIKMEYRGNKFDSILPFWQEDEE